MKEHPILFSPDMVKAILDSRKTQTRRVVKIRPGDCFNTRRIIPGVVCDDDGEYYGFCSEEHNYKCPYGKPGDQLWVRETWSPTIAIFDKTTGRPAIISYKADAPPIEGMYDSIKWKPSIHMPRWASRITLEVVNVRVERVQDITDTDIEEEGTVLNKGIESYYLRTKFSELWDSINAKRGFGWDKNPWVWIIEFKVAKP